MTHTQHIQGVRIHINNDPGKRSVKSIIYNMLHQLMVTLIIFAVLFGIMNISAIYQVSKYRIEKAFTNSESPMNELLDVKTTEAHNFVTTSDPRLLKAQIPHLNIDITPTDNRIVIPRIDKNIPIVRVTSENLMKRDFNALEKQMQDALKDGVVHYPGTSLPSEGGNFAVTGHSSYFPWDKGRFKDVFALLHDVVEGDNIIVYWNQKKYIYEVTVKNVVLPEEVDILKSSDQEVLTLITCTPVGTNLKRLIVTAKPVTEELSVNSGRILR